MAGFSDADTYLIRSLLEARMRAEGFDDPESIRKIRDMGWMKLAGVPEATLLTILKSVIAGQASRKLLASILTEIENHRSRASSDPRAFAQILSIARKPGLESGDSVAAYCVYRLELEHPGRLTGQHLDNAFTEILSHLTGHKVGGAEPEAVPAEVESNSSGSNDDPARPTASIPAMHPGDIAELLEDKSDRPVGQAIKASPARRELQRDGSFLFRGAVGDLEGKCLLQDNDRAPVVLLLHPHPLHGGTMHNKVVYSLNQAFARAGFSTFRFNFRGVGRSQGSYGGGEGELQDAASAVDWVQQNLPNSRGCWIAGFSFGAWIGMQLVTRRPEIDRFIAVALPANIFDFSFLASCSSSGLIVQGDKDDIVPEDSTAMLAEKLSKRRDIAVDYKVIVGANHFFADRLDGLEKVVEQYAASVKEIQ